MRRRSPDLQALATKRAREYIARVGWNRAARRLDARVAEVKAWVTSGRFPKEKLRDALAYNIPGGLAIHIRGTKLADLVTKRGLRNVAKLTGLDVARIKHTIARKPFAAVPFTRGALLELIRKKGIVKLAQELGTKPAKLKYAKEPARTAATERLIEFTKKYGADQAATFLGLTPRRLKSWLAGNIPRKNEPFVNRAIGLKPFEGPSLADVERKKRAPKKKLEAALRKISKWNRKVGKKFQVPVRIAEAWTALGTFERDFEKLKEAYEEAKKPRVKKPKKKPKKPKIPPAEAARLQAEHDFLELRAEYFATGKADQAKRFRNLPWGRVSKVEAGIQVGYISYGKVEKFVHMLDAANLARNIIGRARAMMRKKLPGSPMLTVRFTFCAQGSGNPFYPDAWFPDENKLAFFRYNTGEMQTPAELRSEIVSTLDTIWQKSEDIMLFLEHFELIWSARK